jgi:uncharacterized protein YdgA (DUF945 family)
MKKWLVVLLVLLALLILLSPAIVGRMAENNIEKNIEWAQSKGDGVSIRTESFERGWLASEGRHRVLLDGGRFRAVAEEYMSATGNPELPSLLIDTHLDHGPLPASSMSPGLATAVSTFSVDAGNGATVAVPGALTSNVALNGSSQSHLLLEPGSVEDEAVTFEWTGADMVFESNPTSGDLTAAGDIKAMKLAVNGTTADFNGMAVNLDQVQSKYGFSTGTLDARVGSITIDDDGSVFSIAGMTMSASSAIEDERLGGQTVFELDTMTIPEIGAVDFTADVTFERLDAASFAVISDAFQAAQNAADPQAALAGLYPEIQQEVETLFAKGFAVRMEKVDVMLPQGLVSLQMNVDVPESADGASFSWPGVMLSSTANIDVRIPVTIYELASTMNNQVGALIAMGILVPDGDDFVMAAKYAQGLINVNGVPMPIPIPGM